MASQVKEDSLVFSSLAVSKALSSRSGSKPLATSSSPGAGPSVSRPPRLTQWSGKRSGGRRRFKGSKRSASSSNPSGFRKLVPSPCLTLSGGCLSLHWQAWRDRGVDPWVVEVLRERCHIPFLRPPPLSMDPIPMPSYAPTSIKGAALEEVTLALIAKGVVELAPLPSPGFYSCLFVVWTTAWSWRPAINLSLLNRFVDISHFRMETIQSVLMSIRQWDWMASIDLREASLQVPVHLESRRFLRFVAHGHAYQFTALCFGLSTAPQVFTRVMAPVSVVFHSLGIRMRRYLDDWLVPGGPPPGSQGCLVPLSQVGDRGQPGVVQLLSVSGGTVSRGGHRRTDFYGFSIARSRLQAVVYLRRILSSAAPPASLWHSLLGMLSSLSHLGPGGCPRMSSLQICLHRSWDRLDPSAPVPWSLDCLRESSVVASRGSLLSRCLSCRCPQFWTFGPTLQTSARGLTWETGLFPACGTSRRLFFLSMPGSCWLCVMVSSTSSFLSGTTGAVFSDNVTAVPYLCMVGGHPVSCSQHRCPGDPPLGGISSDSTGSAVHSGDPQCSRGLSLPSSPAP